MENLMLDIQITRARINLCPDCRTDLIGVARIEKQRWRFYCLDCELCVEADDADGLVKAVRQEVKLEHAVGS